MMWRSRDTENMNVREAVTATNSWAINRDASRQINGANFLYDLGSFFWRA